MEKMDLCTCTIRLGGSLLQSVDRYPRNPVSYPEIEILKFLHGQNSVLNIKPVGQTQTTAKDEKARLLGLYKAGIVEQVYPGQNPGGMEFRHPDTTDTDEVTPPKKRRSRRKKADDAEAPSPFEGEEAGETEKV